MRWWPKNQSFWRTIKPFMSDKSASHDKNIIIQEDDKIITNTNEICEIFNTYFTTVTNNIGFDDSIPPDFDTEHGFSNMINKHCRHPSFLKIRENISCDSVFDFQCIHAPDIMQIIEGFDAKKAQGYDMVPMKLLQKSAPYIAPYIAKLANNSFIKGVFPGDLKLAKVSSLFNKASLRDSIAATGLVISNWIQIVNFSARVTVKFDGWPRKTIGHFFYTTSSFEQHFNPLVNSNWIYSPETFNSGRNWWYVIRVTLKFNGWPWKTIAHLFYATSSFVHHFVPIGEFKLKLQSGNAQFG